MFSAIGIWLCVRRRQKRKEHEAGRQEQRTSLDTSQLHTIPIHPAEFPRKEGHELGDLQESGLHHDPRTTPELSRKERRTHPKSPQPPPPQFVDTDYPELDAEERRGPLELGGSLVQERYELVAGDAGKANEVADTSRPAIQEGTSEVEGAAEMPPATELDAYPPRVPELDGREAGAQYYKMPA